MPSSARCSGSCQKVKFEKSSIYFNPNTSDLHQSVICNVLGIQVVTDPGIYLGVPLIVGRNKNVVFDFLCDIFQKQVTGWIKQLLSYGGREVFIKAIAQALPQYIMCCYMLSDGIVDNLVSTMRSFWWTGKSNARGWPLVAWKTICLPKRFGGLGFRDMKQFNLALLGKQVWCLMQNTDELCYKVLSAKYFPNGQVPNAKLGNRPSFAWQGFLPTLSIVDATLRMTPIGYSGVCRSAEEIVFHPSSKKGEVEESGIEQFYWNHLPTLAESNSSQWRQP
ncbi:hypothetical protein V6N13_001092 [Hibiscus sabdariffa]